MERIWDLQRVRRTIERQSFDILKCPLGRLSREQIRKGYAVLSEIHRVLIAGSGKETQLTTLTNQFYSLIPHDYGMKLPPTINHMLRVKEKVRLLETLGDAEGTYQQLQERIVSRC